MGRPEALARAFDQDGFGAHQTAMCEVLRCRLAGAVDLRATDATDRRNAAALFTAAIPCVAAVVVVAL